MITQERNIGLGISTADCAPVLLYDAQASIVGAAHAGWRGAFAGVLEETIRAMEALGSCSEDIVAVIGPCIQQTSYEVGPEFVQRFLRQDANNEAFFEPHHMQESIFSTFRDIRCNG
jgi:YfiH family protein